MSPFHETQMVCRAAGKVHDQVKASPRPNLPIFSANTMPVTKMKPTVTDRLSWGHGLPTRSANATGSLISMSYWTFSDVFEEQGVVKQPFYGGYGVIADDDFPKPAFNAFRLLHDLAICESQSIRNRRSLRTGRTECSLLRYGISFFRKPRGAERDHDSTA